MSSWKFKIIKTLKTLKLLKMLKHDIHQAIEDLSTDVCKRVNWQGTPCRTQSQIWDSWKRVLPKPVEVERVRESMTCQAKKYQLKPK